MAQLSFDKQLFDDVVNHQSTKDRSADEKFDYVVLAGAAIATASQMLNHPVNWKIVAAKTLRTKHQKQFSLPFLDEAFSLVIQFVPSDHVTSFDKFLLKMIVVVFTEQFRASSQIKLHDIREQFLLGLQGPIAQAFIALAFTEVTKTEIDDEVVDDILATFDGLAEKRYEGVPSELNLVVNPKLRQSRSFGKATRPKFDSDFLGMKKTGIVFSGHRIALECDAYGRIHEIKELPLWSLRERSPMRLCPYEYQSLFHRVGQIDGMSFVLNRHGEVIVSTGNEMLMTKVNGKWTLCRTGYAHDRLVSALCAMSHIPTKIARPITMKLMVLALSLRHRRKGGLIVVCKTQADAAELVRKSRQRGHGVAEQFIQSVFEDKSLFDIPFGVLMNGLTLDGATLVTPDARCRAIGVVVNTSRHRSRSEGARTRAAEFASKGGIAIKISEDGPISVFINGTHEFDLLS